MIERTVALIKPNGTKYTREIIQKINEEGFKIIAQKLVTLTPTLVAELYPHHAGKEWFPDYAKNLSSGQTFVMVLERENAIKGWRAAVGSREKTDVSSLRYCFAKDSMIVHGSDSPEEVARETAFFFARIELA